MKKHMKIIRISLIAFMAIALVGCGGSQQKQEETTQERVEQVETTTIGRSTIRRVVDFSTTLMGYETVNISPSLTGKIEHIYVEVGSNVQKGSMLVRMDQTQLNNTKLTHANLAVELQRMDALKESGAISKQVYDQTKLGYDQTAESLAFLEKNTFVRAPFAGVISARNYEAGELYSGMPILVLTQINRLKALINIPESYFPLVKKGMKVDIKSDIYPGESFSGTIEIVYPTIDPATHSFQCKVTIPNGTLKLRPGMYAHTSLPLGQSEAIVVPYQTILKLVGSNERYIYLEKDGKAKRVFVQTGQRFDDMIEIISDEVNEGDHLISVGQAKLVDGVKLNVVKQN